MSIKIAPTEPMKLANLDDYQNVALELADWSALSGRAEISAFNDHVADPSALVERLLSFDVVCVMRERAPLPREVLQHLPRLKLITSTGSPPLFCTRTGKPLSPTNIVRRHLHVALKELNYLNPFTRTHKAGNHAFRRFRNTYLRNYTECPEGLYKYWMGHAGRDMSDLYDKVKDDEGFRRKWAERCGFGFELPAVVPNVPKMVHKSASGKAT
jgi:hypothetical protein